MPQYAKSRDPMERLAILEERLAQLERTGRTTSEIPFFPTASHGLFWEDTGAFATTWETIITPRAAVVSLGLVFIGDLVGSTYTGGAWQVVLNDGAVTVGSGAVPPSATYALPAVSIDLGLYRGAPDLKIQIQTRRTSGATAGGRYGGGGAIGSAPRFARQL
ncbi:hypothetical protein AB0F64_37395 [Streptomyces sp. NPDC026294]|uniref:hypothetical protein n=1 Tax=Streptomyces sp. NPDC026294 TaxID=3155362 RepID=UPI0033EB8CCD